VSKTWVAPRMWDGGRCIVIAGGPSLVTQFGIPDDVVATVRSGQAPLSTYSPFMSAIHDEHVIAVNNSYLLGDWPDICFFGDHGWWRVHRQALIEWPGLKVTNCPGLSDPAVARASNVRYLARDRNRKLGLSPDPGKLSWNFNSGSSAIDLAVHLGSSKVILLGFDMRYGNGGESHWHPGHGHDKKPNYARFMQGFPVIANDAQRLGVEIINCSPGTALVDFPVMNLSEALS